MGSAIDQVETPFNALNSSVKSVEPIRQIGVLAFKNAESTFDLAHVVAQSVHRGSDMTQMLEDDAVGLGHCYFHSILVIS